MPCQESLYEWGVDHMWVYSHCTVCKLDRCHPIDRRYLSFLHIHMDDLSLNFSPHKTNNLFTPPIKLTKIYNLCVQFEISPHSWNFLHKHCRHAGDKFHVYVSIARRYLGSYLWFMPWVLYQSMILALRQGLA